MSGAMGAIGAMGATAVDKRQRDEWHDEWHKVEFTREQIASGEDDRLWREVWTRYYLLLSGGEPQPQQERLRGVAVLNGAPQHHGAPHHQTESSPVAVFFSPAATAAFADLLAAFGAVACDRPTAADLAPGGLGTSEAIDEALRIP